MRIMHFIPAYRQTVRIQVAMCMMRSFAWAAPRGHEYTVRYMDSCSVEKARNSAVVMARRARCDLLLMQDADCWTPDKYAPLGMLWDAMQRTEATAAGAVFALRDGKRLNCEPVEQGRIYEGDVGAGLLLIDIRRLSDVDGPWFRRAFNADGTETVCGEDIYFTRRLRALGHRVVVDFTFPTCHGAAVTLPNAHVEREIDGSDDDCLSVGTETTA